MNNKKVGILGFLSGVLVYLAISGKVNIIM